MEIRNIEFRNTSVEERVISGMAIVFNQISNELWDSQKKRSFREVILPTAVTQEVLDNSDIIFNINHKRDNMVARRYHGKGSLQVELRDDGVAFSFKVPNTQLGNDLLEMIERGEVFDCSFAFIDSGATWDFSGDIPLRTVTNITQLFDFSAVWNGAYSQTEISARSIEEAEEASKAEPATEEVPSNEVSEEPVINTIEQTEVPQEENREVDESYKEELEAYKKIIESL